MNYDVIHLLQDPRGGGLVYAMALSRHARQTGRRVALLLPTPDGRFQPESAGEVSTLSLPMSPVGRLRAIARAARRTRILHVHGTRAAAWALPVLPFATSVVTFHGLHPLRRASSLAYRAAARVMLRVIVYAADATICVGRTEGEALAATGIAPAKLHVIPNGVGPLPLVTSDERMAAREALGLDDRLTVLFLGRLVPEKDPATAIAAMRGLENDAVLLVAGDGPLATGARTQAGTNVTFMGHVNCPRAALAASDVVLNSSRWEGLPLALLEAMWAGVPIVASRVSGNVEAADAAAIFAEPEDVAGFREALRQAFDGDLRDRLAAAGRSRAESLFTLDRMLASTDAVYEAVHSRSGGRT